MTASMTTLPVIGVPVPLAQLDGLDSMLSIVQMPKGIPVGIIVKVDEGQNLFKDINVRPLVDFGTIEEVIIIHTRKIPPAVVRYAP